MIGRFRAAWAAVAILTLCDSPSFAQPVDRITVASFNVLKGDTSSKTLDVFRASGADVVGIQEADGGAAALAKALGWHYREFSFDRGTEAGNSDCAILSRFPITQTLRHGVRIELAPAKEAYVFNAHLRAYPYQPYNIRDGELRDAAEAIRGAAGARGAEIDAILNELAPYVAAGRAVFLTGDFNEPSHLDWTPAAAAAGLHPFALAWPTSTKITAAGMVDSFRTLRPDPVKHPGNTWTPRPEPKEVHDRIDFVYAVGAGVTAIDVRIVGESSANADVVIDGYPSDHRAVATTFTVAAEALARVRKGVNLISNPGAEANPGAAAGADRVLTDWESDVTNTPATAQLYGKSGYPSRIGESGVNCFYGGDVGAESSESHAITQTIDLAALSAEIDVSTLRFDLAGCFGGYADQDDAASLTADFLASHGAVLSSITIGNTTADERRNETTLLPRSTNGRVPARARSVRVTLKFTKIAAGPFSDGCADSLRLIVH